LRALRKIPHLQYCSGHKSHRINQKHKPKHPLKHKQEIKKSNTRRVGAREWGGFYRNATSFLAAMITASSNRLTALDSDKSFSSRTGIVTGIVTDVKFESWEATLVQNCSTGGHSHIMWIKVPGEFRLQRLQDGSFINLKARSLGEIGSVDIVKENLLVIRVAGSLPDFSPDLPPLKLRI